MVGGFAVVLVSLYQTIADVFHHLPHQWVEDILADADAEAERRRREECEENREESPSRPVRAFPATARSRRVATR